MIVYYSGYGCNYSDPERFLRERANLMLSFYDSHKRNDGKPDKRLRGVKKARKAQVRVNHSKKTIGSRHRIGGA